MCHYHVSRISTNVLTGQDLEPVEVSIAFDYMQARAAKWQDEKQFRVPSADRRLMHRWVSKPCNDDGHLPGPYAKGRIQ